MISFIFYAAALIYLVFPDLSPMALTCFSGAILILYGIIKIVGFFSEDLYCLAFRYDLAFGLLSLVVGVLLLVKNVAVARYLTPGLGWMALLDNLFHIQMTKEARDFGMTKEWKLILGLSIVTAALSVLLILQAFPGSWAMHILACVVLLSCGATNHCIVKLMVRAPRQSPKNETETTKL